MYFFEKREGGKSPFCTVFVSCISFISVIGKCRSKFVKIKRYPRECVSGSYVVEAAWVMSVCMCVLAFMLVMAYEVYYEALEFASSAYESVDAVELFKRITAAEMLEETGR